METRKIDFYPPDNVRPVTTEYFSVTDGLAKRLPSVECSNCPYGVPAKGQAIYAVECHRNSPVPSDGRSTHWPRLRPDDFCGEHPQFHPLAPRDSQ